MSVEYRDLSREGEPSFLRPIDSVPSGPRDPMSPRYGPTHRRSPSWVSINQPAAPPPPPQPIPIPTPVTNARDLPEVSDEEHMTVDPDEIADLDLAMNQKTAALNRRRGFVGGFVSGLRRLPKAMLKSYTPERKPVRQATTNTVTTTSSLPQYTEHEQANPDIGPNVVTFVDTTPVEEPAPMEDEELEYQSHYSHITHHTQPSYQEPHHSHSGETEHDHHIHNTGLEDQTLGQDHPDGETTVVQHEAPPATVVNSPQFSMTSDYGNNMTLPTHSPSDVSIGTHFARVHKFFRDMNDLPWVSSSRIAVDFVPGEENRKRFYGSKPQASWYSPQHAQSPLNLLGSPPEAVTGTKSKHASVSTASIAFEQRSYRERPRSRRHQQDWDNRRRSPPRGFGTMYPHGYVPFAPPNLVRPQILGQPLYAYPTGDGGPPTGWQFPEMHQAMPVYIITSPPHTQQSDYAEPISRPPPAQTAP
jgi:hypothetical protein